VDIQFTPLTRQHAGSVFALLQPITDPANRPLRWRILEAMATVTEIGSLISRRPDIRGGRPGIAGTGVSVRRIAQWHNMGLIPEEIARKLGHVSLAQVHAALAYYHANQTEIDADLETEAREAESLERRHRR
jgi:uncharacterized protein (DUF433 family)